MADLGQGEYTEAETGVGECTDDETGEAEYIDGDTVVRPLASVYCRAVGLASGRDADASSFEVLESWGVSGVSASQYESGGTGGISGLFVVSLAEKEER